MMSLEHSRGRAGNTASRGTIVSSMTIKAWLETAIQDADRRGLSALRPILESIARSTSALRTADWNSDATGELDEPAPAHDR